MDFIKLSPDQVLEVEFVVLPLMRCRPGLGGKGSVDRVLLIDEFNSVLPGRVQRIHQTLQTRAEFIHIRHSGTLPGAASVHQRMRTSFVFENPAISTGTISGATSVLLLMDPECHFFWPNEF